MSEHHKIEYVYEENSLKVNMIVICLYRYGEEAGEATEHVFATAGHAANTAWNVSKIRKAINPASSAAALRNSAKNTSKY
jgi:hypothetical protein